MEKEQSYKTYMTYGNLIKKDLLTKEEVTGSTSLNLKLFYIQRYISNGKNVFASFDASLGYKISK